MESPSGGRQQCAVTREDRGALMVYLPENERVSIDAAMLRSAPSRIKWFDPRDGNRINGPIATDHVYAPHDGWEDAVLILTADE